MVDRETFDLIKRKHGQYASWAVWADPAGGPKSNIGDLSVLDPDHNPKLLATLRHDVVMLGLNLSRDLPPTLGNFHDRSSKGQDFKIRYAFADSPYYGAYMTDLIKEAVELKSSDLIRRIREYPGLVSRSIQCLLREFDDLKCVSPTLIAFGSDVYRLAIKHVPPGRYTRIVKVVHYSHYISKEDYRERVLAQLAA